MRTGGSHPPRGRSRHRRFQVTRGLVTTRRRSELKPPVPAEHGNGTGHIALAVHRNTIVPRVSRDHRAQPLDRLPAQGSCRRRRSSCFTSGELWPATSLRIVWRRHGEHTVTPLLRADVRKAEEVKRLSGFLCRPHRRRLLGRERPELDETGLVGMQLQTELEKPLLSRSFRHRSAS